MGTSYNHIYYFTWMAYRGWNIPVWQVILMETALVMVFFYIIC